MAKELLHKLAHGVASHKFIIRRRESVPNFEECSLYSILRLRNTAELI